MALMVDKEKCTGCLRCVLEFPQFCTVDRNPEFYEFGDKINSVKLKQVQELGNLKGYSFTALIPE